MRNTGSSITSIPTSVIHIQACVYRAAESTLFTVHSLRGRLRPTSDPVQVKAEEGGRHPGKEHRDPGWVLTGRSAS
ncbi:unnamed protein product [Boreogadus saida]